MIVSVRGVLVSVDAERAVLELGGVGVELLASGRTLSSLGGRRGEEVSLFTYLNVREDALQLYGFLSARERSLFTLLIAVSGVGPKVALSVLSGYSVEELELAVVRDDVKKFESISGVGKKLAQRLVIELKDKVTAAPAEVAGGAVGGTDAFLSARSALQNLGLGLREAEQMLHGAPQEASLEELMRYALSRTGGSSS